ncbi:hypothetical protein VTL71DRAFT_11960 [Oculimacula yallundae]|uniref:Nucleolar protein Dnt1-like N-terminal domain-containing protein n=1 Tax=Oculimacula yallundae TaxID=86028 RepID=A0ABR4CSR5_9HELO
MASPMGPPLPAGYSLRVQLFGPTAYDATDKPLRCFRVVASPDYTVEEFCVEASRIHQINYGQPLTLKKVQDDQQFDITQSEIIGSLFATASTIRFVQASAIPGREDSVAPNSALRFDPSASRKREREGSSRVEGPTSVNPWKPNKRQRVADPDEPLPSRENEENAGHILRTNGRISDANVIPNSQESIILGNTNGHSLNSRHQHDLDEDSNLPSLRGNSSPLEEATARAQSHVSSSRAKSYHIQRATERGTSVSTAATSPLSLEQGSIQNGTNSTSQRRAPNPRPADRHRNGKPSQSRDEKSIYEDIAPDDEEFGLAALAKQRKASRSARNSPSGFLGLERAKSNLNTPPSGSRRSAPREQNTPGELPLTPNSKEREERKKQKLQAEEARKTRLAAAEARQAEETHQAEVERAKREEQERIEVEEFQRGEAERKAAIARANKAQEEREAKEKQKADEVRRREEARVAKEQADEEKRIEDERLAKEKAAADEAERLREEEEEVAAALRRKKKTPIPEASRHSKSSSPVITKARGGTPGSSSTPFIPGQRKSALKRTTSSQAMRSSSPAGSKASTDDSMSGIELQMSAPKPHSRRVSFRDEPEQTITPIRPPTRILPPKFGTPKTTPNSSTPKSSANVATPNSTTPKPSAANSKSAPATSSTPNSSQILPPARKFTPILPPGRSVTRSSLGRSITPVQSKISPTPKEPTPDAAKKPSPVPAPVARKSITPVPRKSATPVPRKSVTPVAMPKEKSKSVEPETKNPSEDEPSEEDSEEEQYSKPILEEQPDLAVKPSTETDSSEDDEDETVSKKEIDEDETQSHNSSLRDSRSPVIFSQHPRSTDTIKARRSVQPESDHSSESEVDDDDDQDQLEEDSDIDEDSKSTPRNKFLDDEADEGSSSSGSDNEDEAENEEDEDEEDKAERDAEDDEEVEVPNSSPPVLPPHKHQASPKPAGINSTHSTIPDSSALVYPPTSSIAPRPSMKVGVSLSSLNRNRSMLATSSAIKPVVSRSGQRTLQAMDEGSDESEEESDDNSSDSSDSETTKPAQKVKVSTQQDDSDSDSSSNSDSDDEVEDEEKKIRDELALEIAGLNATDNASFLSPKLYKTSTQQQDNSKDRKKKAEKKPDKWVTGQKFNTSF